MAVQRFERFPQTSQSKMIRRLDELLDTFIRAAYEQATLIIAAMLLLS